MLSGAVMRTQHSEDRWLAFHRPQQEGKMRLFCLPFAGKGASLFRAWVGRLPDGVEIWPIQLPGRENRIQERPYTKLSRLVPPAADALVPYLDRPFAFLGHSMGALISFELTRELRRRCTPLPSRLFLSGRAAPHLVRREPPRHNLPHADFVKELQRLNGDHQEVPERSELMQVMLPTIRADFSVCDTYVYSAEAPLDCGLSVWGGSEDPEVSIQELVAWRDQTTASFSVKIFSGDHFFLLKSEALFLTVLAGELEALLGNLTPAGTAFGSALGTSA